jgi:truncated hemoglobin YjbI
MVHEARAWAFGVGAARDDIHADPFELAQPFMPDDSAKLAKIRPDPELWEALGHGKLLRAILTDFYGQVYADPRLSPFFHKVTRERAIDKQYEFLADLFTGDKRYFGLKPFNAHHWMVVSDELFDYRERLIESCMRRHGLADHLVRRWCTIHEMFRRELVKSTPRGLIVDGVERELEKVTEETIEVATVCDGCSSEMPAGSCGRLNSRTGELFCALCAARRVGATVEPPPLQAPAS